MCIASIFESFKIFFHSSVLSMAKGTKALFLIKHEFKPKPTTVELTLSGWRGGSSKARMTKLTAANQKPLTLWRPNFVTFSFYLWDMLWPNFSKIDLSGGLLLLFSHRDVPKIYKMKKFSSTWKLLKLTWGSILGREERFWT